MEPQFLFLNFVQNRKEGVKCLN